MMNSVQIPAWANIDGYRTMTDAKKTLASNGNKVFQYEWMV